MNTYIYICIYTQLVQKISFFWTINDDQKLNVSSIYSKPWTSIYYIGRAWWWVFMYKVSIYHLQVHSVYTSDSHPMDSGGHKNEFGHSKILFLLFLRESKKDIKPSKCIENGFSLLRTERNCSNCMTVIKIEKSQKPWVAVTWQLENVWKRLKERGCLLGLPRSGRKPISTAADHRRLPRLYKTNKKQSARDLKTEWHLAVCSQTNRNRLNGQGLKNNSTSKKPHLASKHNQQRLDFGKSYEGWTVEDWNTGRSCSRTILTSKLSPMRGIEK